MARKVHVVLEDDLDGGPADETMTFAVDGVTYEIDVNAENAQQLRDSFAPYVGAARRVGREGRARSTRAQRSRPAEPVKARKGDATPDPKEVRAWARETGRPVSDRGRVPADLIAEYIEAHG